MIDITKILVTGWEPAIRGMRNPMNSWDKTDSRWVMTSAPEYEVGPNDLELMEKLAKLGGPHAKYRRMIHVTCDILAPLYWWKEFDTYKVGTVANSCSTMHKIHAKEFTVGDFSCEHLFSAYSNYAKETSISNDKIVWYPPFSILKEWIIPSLNNCREKYLETKDKRYWWQMIQLLPSSYNQLRTVDLNYETLANIYANRKDHKLDEWRTFCDVMRTSCPHSQLFTLEGF